MSDRAESASERRYAQIMARDLERQQQRLQDARWNPKSRTGVGVLAGEQKNFQKTGEEGRSWMWGNIDNIVGTNASTRSRELDQKAMGFSEIVSLFATPLAANRNELYGEIKAAVSSAMLTGEFVRFEVDGYDSITNTFSSIVIESAASPRLHAEAGPSDVLQENRSDLSDLPPYEVLYGGITPVDSCTADNLSGEPFFVERTAAEYRQLSDQMMQRFGSKTR